MPITLRASRLRLKARTSAPESRINRHIDIRVTASRCTQGNNPKRGSCVSARTGLDALSRTRRVTYAATILPSPRFYAYIPRWSHLSVVSIREIIVFRIEDRRKGEKGVFRTCQPIHLGQWKSVADIGSWHDCTVYLVLERLGALWGLSDNCFS